MTAFAGVRGTGRWGTDERPKSFRDAILWMNPNGTAPIFALTSKMRTKSITDPQHSWWAEPNDIVRLQLSAALTAAGTSVTVDSTDPSSTDIAKRYGSASNLVPGDILMVEKADSASKLSTELMVVKTVTSGTAFTVDRGQAGTTAAAVADNSYLLKVGNVYAEGSRSPAVASRNPVKYVNYTQIFKTAYEVTGTAQNTYARTGNALKNDRKRRMWDHSQAIEMAILYGVPHESVTDGKRTGFMGGLRHFIPNDYLGSSWTLDNFMDKISPVFDWDTQAGDERMMFVGNGALNKLNQKIGSQSSGGDRFMYTGEKEMYGMTFKSYEVPQGKIFLKTHPLLNRHPVYQYGGYIIDGSMLMYHPLQNRDTRHQDDIEHTDEDTTKGQWITECTMSVDGGGQTMRYIGGFNN